MFTYKLLMTTDYVYNKCMWDTMNVLFLDNGTNVLEICP